MSVGGWNVTVAHIFTNKSRLSPLCTNGRVTVSYAAARGLFPIWIVEVFL